MTIPLQVRLGQTSLYYSLAIDSQTTKLAQKQTVTIMAL